MGSIITGYEHDIFVSYRHKDNRYDGWVTDFIQDLKRELEATMKDDLSIYFDENPIDGLLESHQVDQSLSRKLKCLIFIPVLSRTYCDPRSFAWNYEFLAFNRMVRKDPYGIDITVPSGNVSSRILPVRIHELEEEDYHMLEDKLESKLRAIDFIYQSPGVNRPLRRRDDDIIKGEDQSLYRDQINKLALSIKQIIRGIQKAVPAGDITGDEQKLKSSTKKSSKSFRIKILQQIPLFSRLNDDQLSEIAGGMEMLTVEEGEEVIKKGDPGSSMFVIIDGRVKVHDEDHVFSHMEGGDCFGEYTLIDEIERSATVTTTEATTLFKLEKEVFQEIAERNPDFLNAMLKVMVERLRKLDATQEKLASRHSEISEHNKEIEEQRILLENMHEIKKQTIKIVTDDLRNPLTSSLSIADLLKDELKEAHPDLLEHIEVISRGLKKMNEITLKLMELQNDQES